MKEYSKPEFEVKVFGISDVITTSLGTETTPKEDNDGIWDMDINP